MKTQPKRGFIVSNKAWYGGVCPDMSILVGMLEKGQLTNSFVLEWNTAMNPREPVPFLRAYYDSWPTLAAMTDLIERLPALAQQAPDEETIVALLVELGFEDCTPYTNPDQDIMAELQRSGMAKLTPQEKTALGLTQTSTSRKRMPKADHH